jgi:hypothetical protein
VVVTWPVTGRAVYLDVVVDSIQTIQEEGTVAGQPGPLRHGLELRARPNPSAGNLIFQASGLTPGPLQLTLFDALGRRVATIETLSGGPTAMVEWPESARLRSGRYLARLENDARVASTLVVVR